MNDESPAKDETRASSPDAEPSEVVDDDKAARRRKRAKLTLRIPDDDVKRQPAAKEEEAPPPPEPSEQSKPIAAARIIALGEVTGPEAEHLRASSRPPPALVDEEKTPLMPPVAASESDEGIDVPVDEEEPSSARDTEVALPPAMSGEHPAVDADTTPALPPVRRSSQPPPPRTSSPPRPASQPPLPQSQPKVAVAKKIDSPVPLKHLSEPPRERAQAILDEEEATPIESDRDSTLPLEPDDVMEAVPAPPKVPSIPAMKATLPDAPAPRKQTIPDGQKGRAPLVIVPSHATTPSPIAPHSGVTMETTASRRRGRPWWEDLFNDDFVRTMLKITDEQIAREVDFIEDSLGVAKGGALMDLACGTGRHAIELSRRGYQVVGFDLSLAMLARAADEAQDREQKLNFVHGDMREMTFDETFDGIYCWNTSFGFFEEEKNAHVIQRVHRALRTGGQFLLDVINRDHVSQQTPSLVWFEGDQCICMDEMVLDFITSRMKVKRTMMLDDGRTREIDYSIRIYSLHELGKLLHDHGFRIAEVSGNTSTPGVYFGSTSPRTLILAEKR